MDLSPEYRIVANDADITAVIAARLISLTYTDEAGMDSDVLELVLADNNPAAPIEEPKTGAELTLSLGYDGRLKPIGVFVVDELEEAGWPAEMIIRARAAPQDNTPKGKKTIRDQKTRSWAKGTTFGSMIRTIAAEHGLKPAIGKYLENQALPFIAQTDESDFSVLVRLAKKFDAVVKPTNGYLVVALRGESKSVSGVTLPTITLRPTDVTRWRKVLSKRETAGQVVAYYHNLQSAKRHEVKVGKGAPVVRLKTQYPTREMALEAARSDLRRRKREKTTLSITVPGNADIVAEAKLTLEDFRPGVAGDWVITRSVHTLSPDAGYYTVIEAETPTSEDDRPEIDDNGDDDPTD